MKHPVLFFVWTFALFLLLASCRSTNIPDDVDIGQPLMLVEGAPEFTLSAQGSYTDTGEPYILTTIEVAKGSLVFRSIDDDYKAQFEVRYELVRLDEEQEVSEDNDDENDQPLTGNIIQRKETTHTIDADPGRRIQGYERLRFREIFDVNPGTYKIAAVIRDTSSEKTISRTITTELPDLFETTGNITNISLLSSHPDAEEMFTVGTYDVQSAADSLSFRFFVTRGDDEDPIYAHMRLIEFNADHEPARHMSFRNLPDNSIRNRGIIYSQTDIIEEQSRFFDEETGAIEVEFNIATPQTGSYRFEVFTTRTDMSDPSEAIHYRARDFGMRPPNFPEIASPRELAEPLVYLLNESEFERLMDVESEDELRRNVEEFWVKNIESTDLARDVMSLYYERVVEANKQFSSYKAGWKTDMGMIYILFGPPWYEDVLGNERRWIYGFDKSDPDRVFFFRRTRLGNRQYPFNNWTLERSNHYHAVHYHRRTEWLNGMVLRRQFGS